MENIMSAFGIDRVVKKGDVITIKKCMYCKCENDINITNKLNKSKILIFKCKECGKINQFGDIYNFKTGKVLNNRLESYHDSVNYDKVEWSQNYDNLE